MMLLRHSAMRPYPSSIPIKRLSRFDRPRIAHHFLALGSDDRRLRFGGGQSDFSIQTYVKAVDFEHDALFGVLDDELRLVGVGHLARNDDHAELGISVFPGDRERGIGGALLKHAHTHARNWGARALFMRCLAENRAMMHLAKREGMDVVAEGGEADAWLTLPAADTSSYLTAAFEQHFGRLYYALKSRRLVLNRLVDDLLSSS